jgi:hypothetical protein
LLCTKTGQVSTELGGETASTLNMQELSKLRFRRPPLAGQQDLDRLQARLKAEIRRLTHYEPSNGALTIRALEQTERKAYRLTHLTYESG